MLSAALVAALRMLTLLPPELLTLTFAYLMSVSGFMVTPEMMA